MTEKENSLLQDKHILICLDVEKKDATNTHFNYLKNNFCGIILTEIDNSFLPESDVIIYLCGNINQIYDTVKYIRLKTIYVVKEFSTNYDPSCENYTVIDVGQVPINVHNVGIYFRKLFNCNDYFNMIKNEHDFQTLTESNKPNNALRKGIYLSKVEANSDELQYNLLRCSSNFNGPTDNFRNTDNFIIDQLNNISQNFFRENVEFNHVLAQIYENNDGKKAKIKAHSDKTKDMPKNGLIAFCTFYDNKPRDKKIQKSKTDMFDYCYNETSVLTKLYFKLKDTVEDQNLTKEFSIILYPNSVFLIPLLTNRLYTHEIRPSMLPIDKINVRMGYVVRCSKTKAIFKDNQTYINENGEYTKLVEVNNDDLRRLRSLYFEENTTDKIINYGNINFSMNHGDQLRPNL